MLIKTGFNIDRYGERPPINEEQNNVKETKTSDIIKGIVDKVKPKLVIVIDSLASSSTSRLNKTIQLTDTGIHPGSGVENKRKEIKKRFSKLTIIIGGDALYLGRPFLELCDELDFEYIIRYKSTDAPSIKKCFDEIKITDGDYQFQNEIIFGELENKVELQNFEEEDPVEKTMTDSSLEHDLFNLIDFLVKLLKVLMKFLFTLSNPIFSSQSLLIFSIIGIIASPFADNKSTYLRLLSSKRSRKTYSFSSKSLRDLATPLLLK